MQAINVILIVVMLTVGSYNTVNTKLQYQTCVATLDQTEKVKDDGCPDGEKKFNKPWHLNLYMFLGEATLLIAYGIQRRAKQRRAIQAARIPLAREPMAREPERTVSFSEPAPQELKKVPFYVFAIPAFCDVFGTGLAAVGQMYLDSAIWQMLRSSVIVFSALCSVAFLKRRLQPFHWVGVGIVMCGLVVVATASLMDAGGDSSSSTSTSSQIILGFVLTVFAQCMVAFQMVFEEKLLTQEGMAKTSAKKVVGAEGVWGCCFMMPILVLMSYAPGSDGGSYEDFSDGFYMLVQSPKLMILAGTYSLSIAVYNFVGVTVSKKMTAVVRCLVDSSRILTVWGLSLVLYYGVSPEYGSGWAAHSWLTLIGFAILITGTVLYNDLAPGIVPDCLRREDFTDEAEDHPVGPCARSDAPVARQEITGHSPRDIEGTVKERFERFLQKEVGCDKEMASYISGKVMTSDHEAAAEHSMVGDQQALQCLLQELAVDSEDIMTKYLQFKFQIFLKEEMGFDEEMASNIGAKLTLDHEMLAAEAIGGDQHALQRLMEDLVADSADIMTKYLQLKFQKFLQTDIGFDEEMATYISEKVVTSDHESLVAQAMAGDQQALQSLMKDLGSDSDAIMMKLLQVRLAKFLEGRLHLSHARAASLSEQIVTPESMELAERALEGNAEAQKQILERSAILGVTGFFGGFFS